MNLVRQDSFGKIFLSLGILLQIISFIITNGSWLSLVSGTTGIIAVVWCAERKLSFYWFAWIQLISYVILAYQQNLWGEVGENIFYAITMIVGMFIWEARNDNNKVIPKHLSKDYFWMLNIGCASTIIILWQILNKFTNDTQPFVDSVTTVPAVIAQILMILAYKEQWYFWLIIDVFSIYMWAVAGDWNMVMQFIFWTSNCIYGIKKWEDV